MGCTGETSVTFVQGGCIYAKIFPPHYPYTGSQLSAALAFIQQHPGQVSPVTIDIGANDLLDVINQSNCTITDVTATVQTIFTNYTIILSQLKTALNGAGDLIGMTYYFSYQNMCPNLVPTIQYLDAGLAAVGQRYGAIMAPVFATFGARRRPIRISVASPGSTRRRPTLPASCYLSSVSIQPRWVIRSSPTLLRRRWATDVVACMLD